MGVLAGLKRCASGRGPLHATRLYQHVSKHCCPTCLEVQCPREPPNQVTALLLLSLLESRTQRVSL